MKFVLIALSLLPTLAAADFSPDQPQVYTCQQLVRANNSNRAATSKLLVLTLPPYRQIKEGRPFQMNVTLSEMSGRVARQLFNKRASGLTEDVMLNFEVKGEQISGSLFMDELDQTTLRYNGKKYRFDCNSEE